MIQLADLVCFVTKKFFEIENGYRNAYPIEAKNFYKELYAIIDNCIIRRELLLEHGRYTTEYMLCFHDYAGVVYLNLQDLQTNKCYNLSWNMDYEGKYFLWSLSDLSTLTNLPKQTKL